MTPIAEVDQFITNANPNHAEILENLRVIIKSAVPNLVEQYKWSRPVYGCPKDFCYLAKTKNYVTLGFYNPSHIEDPNKLLEGTGKSMRHIKIKSLEDVQPDIFTKMLQQAAKIIS